MKIRQSRFPLSLKIALAMAIGVLVGLYSEPLTGWSPTSLGEIGKLVIQMIKVIATPLLFLAIIQAIVKTEVSMKSGARMIVVATLNASIALGIGLLLSNYLKPGEHLRTEELSQIAVKPSALPAAASGKIDFLKTFVGYIPNSIVQPFADNQIITIVILALLLGTALKRVKWNETLLEGSDSRVSATLIQGVDAAYRTLEVALGYLIQLIPYAVFGVVAKSTGDYGLAPFKGLGMYVVVGLLGLALHVLVTYHFWLIVVVRMSVRKFWHIARPVAVYAMGANSSLATLPLTLKALDRLGISKSAATLGACVGTNLNNDGIILYEGMAVLFVAQAHGIHLDLGQQFLAAVACMVAAMGVAGVPEAGFISLALVLGTVGLPIEFLPLLLTVDWIVARGRSVVNVLSDMIVSIILDHWEKEKVT